MSFPVTLLMISRKPEEKIRIKHKEANLMRQLYKFAKLHDE